MATIDSKDIVDRIIADNGSTYPDEPPAVRVTEYTNAWDKITWGVVWRGEPIDRYQHETDFVRNPRIIWERK